MQERDLYSYLPKKDLSVKVEIVQELAPVVERISKIIPPDLLWQMFSSKPSETGGRIIFPYSRVDSSILITREIIWLLNKHGDRYSEEEFKKWYGKACIEAFEALLWVKIGFQGLENLAKSPASVNWTSAVGHHVTPEERAERIMTKGKELFDSCLRTFVRFRTEKGITDDYFSQYNVEYLLEEFKT